MRGIGQIHWLNFDPLHPTIYRRTLMDGLFCFIFLLTPSRHYLLYPRVGSTSSTCERFYLRCIINRGHFVEPFAVRLVSTSRCPNYRRDRLSFCLARSFYDFFVHLCMPLWSCMMTLRFLFRGTFRFFAVLSWMALPFQRKKFLVCPPPLLISHFMLFFLSFFFIAWCSGVFSFLLFFPACYYCFISTKWSTFLVGRGQGTRRCEDAKIAIHDCVLYRQRAGFEMTRDMMNAIDWSSLLHL